MRARFADVTFDSELREVSRDGKRLALTPKAFELLEALIASAPAHVPKESLYQRLWPDVVVERGNLHNLIAEIRGAIGDNDHAIIRTIHRIGYALGVPLEYETPATVYLLVGDRQLPLRSGENVIGRDDVGTPDVSRRHVRIVIDGETALIEDLGSKNGTWIGGERLTSPRKLVGQNEIFLGRTRALLRFSQGGASTVTA